MGRGGRSGEKEGEGSEKVKVKSDRGKMSFRLVLLYILAGVICSV